LPTTGKPARSFFAPPPWDADSPERLALEDELPPDHLARLYDRLVDELDLGALRRSYAGRGSKPHCPKTLLKLLLYEHARGEFQPKKWHEHLRDSIAVRWLTQGLRVSLTSLYEFRDRVRPFLAEFHDQVVLAAVSEGHADGSRGALDGTTVAANASRHRLLNLEAVERRLAETPPESRRRRGNLREAGVALQAKLAANAKRRKDERKPPGRVRVALGDPEAPFGLDKLKTFRPLYNVQTMSDVGTDLVLAYATSASVGDAGWLPPMIERTVAATGRPLREVLVDSGYPSGEALAYCRDRDVTLLGPWNENSFTARKRAAKGGAAQQLPKERFDFDPSARTHRCPEGKTLSFHGRSRQQRADGSGFTIEVYRADASDCAACALKSSCTRKNATARTVRRQEHEELVEELKERMKRPESKEAYRLRGCAVERRFADAKEHRGLRRFSGRGLARADAQVGLTMLAHNLRVLDQLRERRRLGETAT